MLWDMEGCSVCDCTSTSAFDTERCCSFNGESFDKENMQECMDSSMKQENEEHDLSLYENTSPVPNTCDGSPTHCLHQAKRRKPLEDLDNNSQDSGYAVSFLSDGNKCSSPRRSFNSNGSMDDDFLDICGLDDDDENAQLPGDFNKLISGSLLAVGNRKSPAFMRRGFKTSVSLTETMPTSNKVRSCLFKKEDDVRCFKRPEPPTEVQSPQNTKRSKVFECDVDDSFITRPLLRTISLPGNEDSIKSALQRSTSEPDLIGDFSKQFCLPLTAGKHSDLKSITPSMLASLVKGHFAHSVARYKIIDCRFPYEFDGGHIHGAINLYTKEQIMDELLQEKIRECPVGQEQDNNKRDILIFHCEFSSERGPNLSRFLRQADRRHNKDVYPFLHYPEVYLLDGGYKNLFAQYSELCIPEAYLPMLHPNYKLDLKHFRTKSKTFNADTRSRTNTRSSSFKRL